MPQPWDLFTGRQRLQRIRMRLFYQVVAIIFCCHANQATASCLDEVASFAARICGDIEKSGTKRVVDASGKLDADVGSIVRRVVGGGSADVSGSVLIENYNNVLQNQLGSELFNVRACRERMVGVAVSQVCQPNKPPPPPGDRRPPGDRVIPRPGNSCNYAVPGFRIECATNFGGFVVDRKDPPFYGAPSVESCAAFCRARRDCVAFNYNLKSTSNCFLYKGVGETRYDESIVSGFK